MNKFRLKLLLIYTFFVMNCNIAICIAYETRNGTISENSASTSSNISNIYNITNHQRNFTVESNGKNTNTTSNSNENVKTMANSWLIFGQETRKTLRSCLKNHTLFSWACLREGSLQLFDKLVTNDVIPLTENTRLVRYRHQNDSPPSKLLKRRIFYANKSKKAVNDVTWSGHVLEKIADILTTHVFQIDLYQSAGTAKGRHRRNQMLPMMIFGVTALGMILVPMGFQFLTVLGGKALLLAKMALLLASINGLKRVASSGVSYGFYQQGPPHGHGHGHHGYYWDRDGGPEQMQHPR